MHPNQHLLGKIFIQEERTSDFATPGYYLLHQNTNIDRTNPLALKKPRLTLNLFA
jgi:hypothetical protein